MTQGTALRRLSAGSIFLLSLLTGLNHCSAGLLEPIHHFETGPGRPAARLVEGRDGALYGTTTNGGAYDLGTVFKLTTNRLTQTLASFDGTNGSSPQAPLLEVGDGVFCGTATGGGAHGAGTVFRISPGGGLVRIASFDGTNGEFPRGALVQTDDGSIYGTCRSGGASDGGTVFRLGPGDNLSTFHSFNGAEGEDPRDGLVLHPDNHMIYGTTYSGGRSNLGTIFSFTPDTALATLISFVGTNGARPTGTPVVGTNGSLYGPTTQGGDSRRGTIYRLAPSGDMTTLHSFSPSDDHPEFGMVRTTGGRLYGIIPSFESGILFEVRPNGVYTITAYLVHSYASGELTAASDGFLYAFNRLGPPASVMAVTTKGQIDRYWILLSDAGGANPSSSLLAAPDGNLYGSTWSGGPFNAGTVFRVTPDGTFTTLARFSRTNGTGPSGSLARDGAGSLYGTTACGAMNNNMGGIFKLDTNGNLSSLVSFDGTNGAFPNAGLFQSYDGTIYGTTSRGGESDRGTVFRLDSDGSLKTLFSLSDARSSDTVSALTLDRDQNLFVTAGWNRFGRLAADGIVSNWIPLPESSISIPVRGSDGDFYSATSFDGGQVIRFRQDGTITAIASIPGLGGREPYGALVETSDGDLFGTAYSGGSRGLGAAYRVSKSGSLVLAGSFDGANGAGPIGSLAVGPDGNLYGVTTSGGAGGGGTIYRLINTPRLRVSLSTGGTLLSWPTIPPGFVLESSPNLSSSSLWSTESYASTTNGGFISATAPLGGEKRYFRLRQPP